MPPHAGHTKSLSKRASAGEPIRTMPMLSNFYISAVAAAHDIHDADPTLITPCLVTK